MKKSLLLLALLLVAPVANAEEKAPIVARKMFRADELPYGEVKKLAPAQVALPGAKEGGAVPASWKNISWDANGLPNSRCLDGRTASVESFHPDVRTLKITTIDGKDFLDEATISLAEDKVKVTEAKRTPVLKVLEAGANAIWAYRRQGDRGPEVVFVSAVDHGVFDRAIGYGCVLSEHSVSLPTKTLSFASSATTAHNVAQRIWQLGQDDGQRRAGKGPAWVGENYGVEASTSKSATDPAPMVAVYIRR